MKSNPDKDTSTLPGLVEILREFLPHLRHQRGPLMMAFGALVLEVVLRLVEPWPLKWAFDSILGRNPDLASIVDWSVGTWVAVAAIALVLIATARALAAYWNSIGFARVGNSLVSAIRADLFRKLQMLPLCFHARNRGGDMVMRVVSDSGMLQDVAVTALLPLLVRLLVLVGMVGVMFWMEWRLALVAVSVAPLFYWRAGRISKGIRESARQQRRREGAMAAAVAESIGAMKIVQAQALGGVFDKVFSTQSQKNQREDLKGKRLAAGLERTVDVLIAMATALVLWRGADLVLKGALTPGGLLVFLAYLKSAYRPLQDLAKYTGRLGKASAAAGRVLEILRHAPSIVDLPNARSAEGIAGRLRLEGVCFGYTAGRDVLSGATLEVAPGETVAILGASGSGKSTLLSLVARLYEPRSGRICVDDIPIREFAVESLRRQMSMVLQENAMFSGTIHENIAMGLEGVARESVEAAARLANAHEFIESLPGGYDTVVGERGVTLSQGQRQRLAIARAALRPSVFLLLDEPTTGLDAANEALVLEALRRLARTRTTLWVTHNPEHVLHADRTVHVREGGRLEIAPSPVPAASGKARMPLFEETSPDFPRGVKGEEVCRVTA